MRNMVFNLSRVLKRKFLFRKTVPPRSQEWDDRAPTGLLWNDLPPQVSEGGCYYHKSIELWNFALIPKPETVARSPGKGMSTLSTCQWVVSLCHWLPSSSQLKAWQSLLTSSKGKTTEQRIWGRVSRNLTLTLASTVNPPTCFLNCGS